MAARVYDRRNTCEGGLGNGWSMPHEPGNVQTQFSYPPAEGWEEHEQVESRFTTYLIVPRTRKIVALRIGDQVWTFRMKVSPNSSFMRPIMDYYTPLTISYTPMKGTKGELEALGLSSSPFFLYSHNNGTLADADGNDYAPTRFKLTLEDGSIYVVDSNKGLISMTDPYGHAIEYRDDGITHSSGASLTFTRDTSNRIEGISDAMGRMFEYRYDEYGMLEDVVQLNEGPFDAVSLSAFAYLARDLPSPPRSGSCNTFTRRTAHD